jgi:hypothetical protein
LERPSPTKKRAPVRVRAWKRNVDD